MKFVITVDTEADNQWKRRRNIELKNINFLPRFAALCAEFNFPPTYLVSYEVAADKKAVELLSGWQNSNQAEVGAHLHPWTTPPWRGPEKEDNTIRAFPNELPSDLLAEKLENLTKKIKEAFGRAPTSFRAGRWGFDHRIVDYLAALGYLVDCSISPKVDWRSYAGWPGGSGGPDFRFAAVTPYYIAISGQKRILEVPMTILFTGIFKKENSFFAKKYLSLADGFGKKAVNRMFFRQKWLRVFANSTLRDWREIYQSAAKNRLPVLQFMVHSSELMPGGSPYWKTRAAVEVFYQKLAELFNYLKIKGVKGVTLTQFAQSYDKTGRS